MSLEHESRDVVYFDRLVKTYRLTLPAGWEQWMVERAAHRTAVLTRSKRLPVYLNAIEAPSGAGSTGC